MHSELKSVMQEVWLYINDFGDFIKKLKKKNDHIPKDAIVVTVDVVSLYPSISHEDDDLQKRA